MPGTMAATPAYAASTCSQIRSASQMSATARTGSTLVVDVVPTVATTATGHHPADRSSAIADRSASGRRRNASSTGVFRSAEWPIPSRIVALSIDEWACSEQ